jgi:hypothetical protein
MSDRLDAALRAVDEAWMAARPARRSPVAESHRRRVITESSIEGVTVTLPQKPTLTEADIAAIAAKVVEGMKQPKPLHEMSDAERDRYSNEVWMRAGVIGGKTT